MENKFTLFNKQNSTISKSSKQYGFTHFAKHAFRPGETVLKGFGKLIGHQTRHLSIQIGMKKHFLPTYWTGRNFNHSCEPNCHIKTRSDGFPDLIALRKINTGDEITFAYWMTEYEWAKNSAENHISCLCGAKNCKSKIYAFSQLSSLEKRKTRRFISNYLSRVS